jgi:hypothetical protein
MEIIGKAEKQGFSYGDATSTKTNEEGGITSIISMK